jgi:hypothetical protein
MSKPLVLSINTLFGYKVRNAVGENLGKIEEIVIDDDGRVLYGVMWTGRHLTAVPWEFLQAQSGENVFLCNIDRETLTHAPYFNRDNWPDMSLPEWQERISAYFAYAPAGDWQTAESLRFIKGEPQSTRKQKTTKDDVSKAA